MLFLLITSILMAASTPEEFLIELCDNSEGLTGAEFWASHTSAGVRSSYSDPDSIANILSGMNNLSVSPGTRTSFESSGDTFRIEFGESVWTWTDTDGNQHMKEGLAVVTCEGGIYSWSQIPALVEGSINVGRKERLITGIIMTFMLLTFAVIFLMWAKRRYL
jgi:hypothetical protein